MFSWYLNRLFTLFLLLFIISGCGDQNDEESSSSTPKLSSFWPELNGCLECHSPDGVSPELTGPDMSTPTLFVKNLVGKKKSDYPDWYTTSDCSTSLAFITPGNASKSTLMAALTEEDSTAMQNEYNCSSSFNIHDVNHANIKYNSTLYRELTEWINAGALNN